MPPTDDFNFDIENSGSSSDETRNEKRPQRGRAKATRGNAAWTDIVSGLGPMQWGTIALLLASTFLFYRLQSIPTDGHPLAVFLYIWNTFIISLLLAIAGGGCFAFGHISASKAPDPSVNQSVTVSLILSLVSVLAWMGFLGVLIYFRVYIERIVLDADELKMVVRIGSGCFCVAVLSALIAELIFVLALRRAGWLLRDDKLRGWSIAMIVLFSVTMALNIISWVMIYFEFGRKNIVLILMDFAFLLQLIAYLLALGVSGCYWYTLQIGKWTLTHPEGAREQSNEDQDAEDLEIPRGKRSHRRDDDDDEDRPRKRKARE